MTGWRESIQAGTSGAVQNLEYEWDLVGNLKKRRDLNQSSLTEEFFYDNLYRLDYSQRNGSTNLDMAYDALGNITSKSDVGTYTYHGTKKHQVTSTSNGWSFAYDGNGNMTSGRGATITWTSYNYPASIANGTDTASFSYTPDRRYWRQISNYTSGGSATTIYVGGILEKVTTSAATDYRHMIRAGNASIIVSRKTVGGNSVYYVTQDHLGSSSAITNSSGGILVNSSFDAFGKRRGSNWSGNPSSGDRIAIEATTRRGFTGHSMLDNLNLIHMNGRVHDPAIGRFLSADPFVAEMFNTQNFDRYGYVFNNPLSATDPSGFFAFCPPWNYEAGPTEGSDGGSSGESGSSGAGSFYIAWGGDCSPPRGDIQGRPGPWAPPKLPEAPQGADRDVKESPQGDHDYRAWNKVCKRALTEAEQRDLIRRFTVPNTFTTGWRQSAGINLVASRLGIPGGFVTTTFSSDGLAGRNVTTPVHIFRGAVDRSIVNTPDGAFMQTHGYGGYGVGNAVIPPSIETGGAAIDLGLALDGVNDVAGPQIFNGVDRQAARYAKHHFEGC